MRQFFFPLFLLFAVTSIAQKQKTAAEHKFDGLDTAFSRVLKDWHAAGFAVAVVEKNKVMYMHGFGYRDYENKVPVTPTTLFAIGSCTKAFTSSLLGLLRKEGKLDFDKPVRTYYPELQFYNEEMNDKITLRDMMSHRTGLPRHDMSWYLFSTNSRDSLVQRIQYMEPSFGLREKWQYNNFMFMLQGALAEKLTHKSWEENIREKILVPLGMYNTVFTIDDMEKSGNGAKGYMAKDDSLIKKLPYYHIDAMGPAGSINSCVQDMAHWVMTWINGGKYDGKEILPGNYVTEAMSSQMVAEPALPDKEYQDVFFSNYGLGWSLGSYRGHYRVTHGGNIDGFSASTSFFPSDSIGIIVLVNQNGSTVPSVVRNLVADRMLGLKYIDWHSNLKKAADKRKAGAKEADKTNVSNRKMNTKPSHDLKDYTGNYTNKGYGSIQVMITHDSLYAKVGKHDWWLRHYHYDQFDPFEKDPEDGIDTTDTNLPLEFQTNTSGAIESVLLHLEPSTKPIEFSRSSIPKAMTKDSLQKYVGEYDLGGVVATIFLKNEQGLGLLVPGQPEYELVAIDKDKFSIRTLTGFSIQFNRNEKNEVTELLSIQPNGTFKAVRKK